MDTITLPKSPDHFYENANLIANKLAMGVISSEIAMRDLFTLLDGFMDFIKSHSKCTCAPGCSYCCFQDIPVTYYEADSIHRFTGLEFADTTNPSFNNRNACSFLKNNQCSIYPVRPFVCRTYISFSDPDLCRTGDGKRILFGQPIPDISRPHNNNFQSHFLKGLYNILLNIININYPGTIDIRDLFPVSNMNGV